MSPREGTTVPAHEHITVDEETYWGLMYLLRAVSYRVEDVPSGVRFAYEEAERRLQQTREWNEADPSHWSRSLND